MPEWSIYVVFISIVSIYTWRDIQAQERLRSEQWIRYKLLQKLAELDVLVFIDEDAPPLDKVEFMTRDQAIDLG